MPDSDLEHLNDHLDLVAAMLKLRQSAAGSEDPEAAEALAAQLLGVLGEIQARIDARNLENPGLAANRLERRLGCSSAEVHTIWVLAAAATRPDVRAQLGWFIGDPSADPSLDTLRRFVHGDRASWGAFEELSSSGRLRRLGLIERSDSGADVHEMKQTWTISRRILALLHGDNSLDPSLARICRIGDAPPQVDDLAIHREAVDAARRAVRSQHAVVVASGMPGLGRRTLLAAAAHEAGIDVLEIDARRLAKDPAVLAKQLRAIARECKLLARTPLVANLDALVDDKQERIELVGSELVPLIEGLVLVTTGLQRPAIRWDRPAIVIELSSPTSAQRERLWLEALGEGSKDDAELLASQYPLAPALIHHAAQAAKVRASGRRLEPEDLYAGIRAVLDDRLGQFARRVTVTQTWDDLVLPQEQVDSIVELIARIRERRRVYEDWGFAAKVGRGLGVSALFSGPPGTGKTMVAALIARDLGLELYQVDLGKVVSKWIGETEKNLAALFDAAEAGHAILLFDEADALFGKRTEVKSSNDRYANLETNYLLQRLESFTGICLLTSNHESNIDPAFQRRLSLHLRFELPDADVRADLWRATLPKSAPVAPDLDLTSLARRYAMSGGYIRNAALRAAFLAADDGGQITIAHLDRAARLEYEGLGKIAS